MDTTSSNLKEGPVRRLSYVRLSFVLLILATGVGASVYSFIDWQEAKLHSGHAPWFAAYVDVTSVPYYSFERMDSAKQADDVVLSFIVASPSDPCVPSWGGYYTMDEAAVMLDLDRRIARLQQQGGRIAVSFGGLLNSELALACTDKETLGTAYQSVIDRYNVTTIDLDLENESLRDKEALIRRAQTISELQENARLKGKPLAVWLTLPVLPQGLTKEGTDAVAQMLASGVDIAGVNIMTMNYGEAKKAEDSMAAASKQALLETHRQLGVLYSQAEVNLTAKSLWRKIGATPMIGQNDLVDEIFTLDDAVELNAFAREQGIVRMSMWSANRDIACSENYVDLKVVSDLCSGVATPSLAFAQTLSKGFEGDLLQNAGIVTTEDTERNEPIIDNPLTSPYPIWNEASVYLKATKVVWRGNVYEAKWWTKNDLPDNPILQTADTPWQLIGPVLPGDKPVKLLTLPDGIYPTWEGIQIYNEGQRVMFDGMPYEAKWWNQGESPAAAAVNPDNSPWLLLTQEQIWAIREARGL